MSESRRRPNTFAGPHVQRHSAARRDTDTLRQLLSRGEAAVAPVWNSRLLVRRRDPGSACLLDPAHPALTGIGFERLVLLGEFAGRLVFAAEIEATTEPCLEPETGFIDLRTAGATLPHDQAGLLAYAGALIAWRRRHRHCGSCGAPTVPQQAGHVLVCSNLSCRQESFPRIDPAVIVLVTDGERALLGRQSSWPPGRYSTVAGFVEPGESLEDAAAREVFEETGVPVVAPVYHSSQPWPFPSSLMVGFVAEALDDKLNLNREEIDSAAWFTREQLINSPEDETFKLSRKDSISRALVNDWIAQG